MTSNKEEINFMLKMLGSMNQKLGGAAGRRALGGTQFDFIQQQFLSKRHHIDKLQSILQKQGTNSKTASYGYQIREGIQELKKLFGKMKEEHRRLQKKKKETPQILAKKTKIIDNCQLLLQDLEEKQEGGQKINNYKPKVTTLTDMRAKLLSQIDQKTHEIHQQQNSDGKLSEQNQEQIQAIKRFKKNDQEMDQQLDGIIDGIQIVKGKVRGINQRQDQIHKKIQSNTKAIVKTTSNIQSDNQKLKKIIQSFKPSRCILGIVLMLLFIGLIVVIIKLLA